MVGYMSEAAALEIGGNPLLARAGADYHDVGKMKKPEYFAENQNGVNPHDMMDPDVSAAIITAHTVDGIEMCEKYKLPQEIINIVGEHHGDSKAAYFYNKACKLFGAENVNELDYRYRGPRPSSKESAIVMLADSCEATVRSSESKSEEDIGKTVERIINGKIDDGQLRGSDISIVDIDVIKREFVRVLCGFYHSRIKYPGSEPHQIEDAGRVSEIPGKRGAIKIQ
jgi:putative nucleotidyltransferase with HDIG domain